MKKVQRRVALLSMPRTGSTMITRQLARHPQVYFVGALFSREGWPGDGPGRRKVKVGLDERWEDLDFRIANRDALLDRVFNADKAVKCSGLKHHLSGSSEVTETILDDKRIAVVLLRRRNVLACYSSHRLVDLKKENPDLPKSEMKAVFDPDEFARYLRSRRRIEERWIPLVEDRQGAHMTIDYMAARTTEGIQSVMDFLGFDDQIPPQNTQKRNSDNIIDRFRNPETVDKFLVDEGLKDWEVETV